MENKGLRVIGVGWGRTGTKTLCKVLTDDFGLKCHHMEEVFANDTANLFYQLAMLDPNDTKTRHKLFDQIFDSNSKTKNAYLATVDWPTTKFWRELIDYYPNAKVLLSIRDPEKWYKSASQTIWKAHRIMQNCLLIRLKLYKFIPPMFYHEQMMTTCLDDKLPSEKNMDDCNITSSMCGKFNDKEYIINKFNKHIEQVKEYVSKDRLVIIDVTKHGYDQLIEGIKDVAIKIPNDKRGQKFARTNTNSGREWRNRIMFATIARATFDVIIVAIVTGVVFKAYQMLKYQ